MKLPATAIGERYDRAIRALLIEAHREVSVREVRSALERGAIRIDGKKIAPGARVRGGESIDLEAFTARGEAKVEAEPDLIARTRVVFHDDSLLVLDKPSGMPVHPLLPDERGTLLAVAIALDARVRAAGPPLEGGLLHRLDIETSGLVMFALQENLRTRIRAAFRDHQVSKAYFALVRGTIDAPCVVEGAIARGPTSDRVRVVLPDDPRGRPARTEVEMIAPGLACAKTNYGRRHQVRAHLASIGLPIIGDRIYGVPDETLGRLGLHASQIVLPDGRRFESPLPADLARWVGA